MEAAREIVLRAEESGFDLVLVAERHRGPDLEAWILTAALASLTSRIRIMPAVYPGLWHPTLIAKMAASLDRIAPGRSGNQQRMRTLKRRRVRTSPEARKPNPALCCEPKRARPRYGGAQRRLVVRRPRSQGEGPEGDSGQPAHRHRRHECARGTVWSPRPLRFQSLQQRRRGQRNDIQANE